MRGLVAAITGQDRRAFSLVEVMVALLVLLLIGALVAATMHGFSETVEFKETCDQLSSAVSVCHTEAQRRGTPMELVARTETDGRVSLVGRPAVLDDTKADTTPVTGQVLMVLPSGYTIDHDSGMAAKLASETAMPGDDANATTDTAKTTSTSADDDDESGKPLIVFWASGGASTSSGLYLHGRDGRVVGAGINSWTGMLKLQPIADDTDGEKTSRDSKKFRNGSKSGKPSQGKPGDGGSDVDPNGP